MYIQYSTIGILWYIYIYIYSNIPLLRQLDIKTGCGLINEPLLYKEVVILTFRCTSM